MPPRSYSLGILDDIANDNSISDLITENILAISPSKRVFFITNENRTFTKGDFISFVYNAKLTARALVAKTSDKGAGVKILKIYNWQRWQQLAKGLPLQIIRGDDSYFKEESKKKNSDKEESQYASIKSEEDLFNNTEIVDEGISENDKSNLIKQDNIVSLNYGTYPIAGNSEGLSLSLFNLSYEYQLGKDFWLGLTVGTGTLQKFPSVDLNTNITTVSARGAYLFKLPFYSYLMPYVGFNYQLAESPKAGTSDGTNTQAERDLEVREVESINTGEIVFGAKVIRHLAPGWYAMLGIGTDIMQGGIGIEF